MIYIQDKQLIIGLDPGTTTGIAAIDLDGKLVLIESRKNMSKQDVMLFISSIGRPLILACDINPTPKSLEKVAASLPTRIISPKRNLSKKGKNEIVKEYAEKLNTKRVWNNTHEKDALASALFAWGKLKPLIDRVKKRLKTSEIFEEEIRRYVMQNVIIERESITNSLNQYPEAIINYKISKSK